MFVLIFVLLLAASAQAATIPGLNSNVSVSWDKYGIPHIQAKNLLDAFRVQGYVQARDRFNQMDFLRHQALGQLSEILGEESLEQDYRIRMLGIPKVSQQIWEQTPKEGQEYLLAFCDGVNAYIKESGLQTRPWEPEDTIAVTRMTAWGLSGSFEVELLLFKMISLHGKDKVFDLIDDLPENVPSVRWSGPPAGITNAKIQMSNWNDKEFGKAYAKALDSYLSKTVILPDFNFSGSNNWVAGPSKTKCKCAILANDPHMSLWLPPIWYEVHLQTPEMNVVGTTFPASPGVIIGHNDHIAWGMTMAVFDVTDAYLEKKAAGKQDELLYDGSSYPIRKEKTTIKVKTENGMKDVEREIWHSKHGPIVLKEGLFDRMISFRWTGMEPTTEFLAFMGINRAKNLSEFKAALQHFKLPSTNFVYADRKGNIFYQATGLVPIRKGEPYLPLEGTTSETEWQGYIPYDKLPKSENPKEGFLSSANQRPVDKSYPYYIGLFFAPGYRQRRIVERLSENKLFSFEDVRDVQADNIMVHARRIMPHLLKAIEGKPELENVYSILSSWKFDTRLESSAATLYHKWLKHIIYEVFESFLGKDFNVVGNQANFTIPVLVKVLEGRTKHDWFNGKRDEVLRKSLSLAMEELSGKFGKDQKEWMWGKLHKLALTNLLRQSPHPDPSPRHGGLLTVDVANPDILSENYPFSSGPSIRFAVEMGKTIRGENVLPGGQSDNPSSPHYTDQLPLWVRNQYRPMLFTKEEIAAGTIKTETFSK